MSVDQAKLQAFMGKMIADLGAAMGAPLVIVGDKLGFYRAIAAAGSINSIELAERTGTSERYVREWLAAQAAAGYLQYDVAAQRYSMTREQEMVFAAEGSPTFMPGAFEIIGSMLRDEPKIAEAFRTGLGVGWHEHDLALFRGTERFFRPGYAAHLVSEWIPALQGMREKLERGVKVADVGCGHGASTILMAQAFPNSTFVGFDYHQPSLERATEAAREAGVTNVHFERATAKDYPGKDYGLVAFFDCLHDMGDPVGAGRHVLESLKPDGTWMVVEPFAKEMVAENLTPVGRVFYNASLLICVPASLSQEVGRGLGAQASDSSLEEVFRSGGFTRVRKAVETPFNRVFEMRP